jgi:hypothetical protein
MHYARQHKDQILKLEKVVNYKKIFGVLALMTLSSNTIECMDLQTLLTTLNGQLQTLANALRSLRPAPPQLLIDMGSVKIVLQQDLVKWLESNKTEFETTFFDIPNEFLKDIAEELRRLAKIKINVSQESNPSGVYGNSPLFVYLYESPIKPGSKFQEVKDKILSSSNLPLLKFKPKEGNQKLIFVSQIGDHVVVKKLGGEDTQAIITRLSDTYKAVPSDNPIIPMKVYFVGFITGKDDKIILNDADRSEYYDTHRGSFPGDFTNMARAFNNAQAVKLAAALLSP